MFLLFLVKELLGLFFFVGLYWTVHQLTFRQDVAVLFLGSMLFRTSVVVVGFYFILGDHWQRLVAGLIGFTLIRLLAIGFIHVKKKGSLCT